MQRQWQRFSTVGKETGELVQGPDAASKKLLEKGFYWLTTEMAAGNVNGKIEGMVF